MPEKATPREGAVYPPTLGGEADSSGGFGGDDPPHSGSGWISPFRIGLAVVVLVAALVGWQLTRTSSPAYRTSAVGTGTVVATLTSVGTITPVNQANLNFNVSGTVSTVDVSVGQTVTEGQTLASLDVADLNASVVSAQATLASATATLSDAEASETATTTSDTTTSTATATTPPASATTTTVPTSGAAQPSQNDQRINQLQATLVADQRQEDADSAQATGALKQATAVCDAAVSATDTPPAAGTSTTPSAPPGGAPPTGPPTGTGPTETCSAALAQASSAQAKVTADIKTVDQDESALNGALGSSSGAGGGTPTGGSGTGGSGGGGGGTHPTGGGTGGTSGATPSGGSSSSPAAAGMAAADTSGASTGSDATSTPKSQSSTTPAKKAATPQQLAVDQASIDTAQANLTDSQQALGGANLVSTIAGTVASVSIAAGDSVTAGSTSAAAQIVIIGTGSSYEVTTDVPVASVGEVTVGQQALITPDATNTVLNGQVEAIGILASSGSTSTTYPVTISLQSSDLGQLSGADANVAIIVKRSVGVTTVPSSAVRTVGSVHLVTVVDNNTAKAVRVTLGTVGATLTQVISGVSVGQAVSLADLNQPLPSTSSTTTRFGGLGAGGLGAGGLGGAGLGGGAGGFGGGGGFVRSAG